MTTRKRPALPLPPLEAPRFFEPPPLSAFLPARFVVREGTTPGVGRYVCDDLRFDTPDGARRYRDWGSASYRAEKIGGAVEDLGDPTAKEPDVAARGSLPAGGPTSCSSAAASRGASGAACRRWNEAILERDFELAAIGVAITVLGFLPDIEEHEDGTATLPAHVWAEVKDVVVRWNGEDPFAGWGEPPRGPSGRRQADIEEDLHELDAARARLQEELDAHKAHFAALDTPTAILEDEGS